LTGVVGDRPALDRIVMAGANNAVMRGIALATASSESVFINGTSGVTIAESSASSSISGININNSSASAEGVSFTSSTSTGGVNGILLNNLAGNFDFGTGSLSGNTGVSFLATGTLGTTSYGGTITKASNGNLVEISGAATGTVTLSGDLNCTSACDGIDVVNRGAGTVTFSGATKMLNTGASAAVNLDNNDAATMDFSGGGLSINTTSGMGFNAINGASAITIGTGANPNTIASTTGIALNVVGSTIGATGMNFRSISASGGPNGIVLDDTGSNGGLSVSGDGSDVTLGGNSTGGTLSGMVGADGANAGSAIFLRSTSNVVLRRMTINGTNQNFGIRGFQVNGFTLEHATVSGNSGTSGSFDNYGEGAIMFGDDASPATNGLTGSATIGNSVISGGRARNLSIVNTAGTLNRISVTNSTFGALQNTGDAGDSLSFEARNAGTVLNATVTGSTFTSSAGDLVEFVGQTGTTMDVIANNNTLSNNHAGNVIGGGGITIASQGVSSFNHTDVTARDAHGTGMTLFKGSAGTSFVGRVDNTDIGVTGVASSGSASGNGVLLSASGAGTITLALVDSQILGYEGNAGLFADNTDGTYDLNLTLTGNRVAEPGGGAFAGLALAAGAPSSADDIDVCAQIGGAGALQNDFSTGDLSNSNDVILGVSTSASSMVLPGYAGASLLDVQSFVLSNNNVAGTVVTAYVDAPATAANFTGGAACPTPP
jgi:hypothetical protein